MTKSLEKQLESKDAPKKTKYELLEPFMKQMILNASATSSEFSATEPTAELVSIINCSSLARSQTMLNFYLHKSKCNVDAPLSLVTALVSGDWIVRRSIDPGRLSLLLLGHSLLQNKSNTIEKTNLNFKLQELYSSSLSDDNINTLIQQNYTKIHTYGDLLLFV